MGASGMTEVFIAVSFQCDSCAKEVNENTYNSSTAAEIMAFNMLLLLKMM